LEKVWTNARLKKIKQRKANFAEMMQMFCVIFRFVNDRHTAFRFCLTELVVSVSKNLNHSFDGLLTNFLGIFTLLRI